MQVYHGNSKFFVGMFLFNNLEQKIAHERIFSMIWVRNVLLLQNNEISIAPTKGWFDIYGLGRLNHRTFTCTSPETV
jgi:hypothetical protein